jgi:hypothetical protein
MITTIETDLLQLEKRYWQAIKDRDLETARSLTDFPCLVAGKHGTRLVDEETYGEMMSSESMKLRDFAIAEDANVRFLSEDVAVVAYRVREDMLLDGTETTLDAADTSTWVRREGAWRCAAHTEALLSR